MLLKRLFGYFYPRSPCGERRCRGGGFLLSFILFLSTLSLRRATRACIMIITICTAFLSTLSLRRATYQYLSSDFRRGFSIHALLAESDVGTIRKLQCVLVFYPRSPCGERPRKARPKLPKLIVFYPRSPCGERRITIITICTAWSFLSTLSLRRATLGKNDCGRSWRFSIHALLAESDQLAARDDSIMFVFLSTLSLRRATGPC